MVPASTNGFSVACRRAARSAEPVPVIDFPLDVTVLPVELSVETAALEAPTELPCSSRRPTPVPATSAAVRPAATILFFIGGVPFDGGGTTMMLNVGKASTRAT